MTQSTPDISIMEDPGSAPVDPGPPPTIYYKATDLDGKSYMGRRITPRMRALGILDGRIDYAAALESGAILKHHSRRMARNHPSTYISTSIQPGDCTGHKWPCRLFEVEPIGEVISSDMYPHKRATRRLRVVRELDPKIMLGPNADRILAFLGLKWGPNDRPATELRKYPTLRLRMRKANDERNRILQGFRYSTSIRTAVLGAVTHAMGYGELYAPRGAYLVGLLYGDEITEASAALLMDPLRYVARLRGRKLP